MAGKRKFLIEEMGEWTDAEIEFVELCAERKWIIDNEEGTGVPVLYPTRKKDKGTYTVYVHGRDSDGEILMGFCITAEHGRTKKSLLSKAEKANLNGTVICDGDTDAIYLFPIERLPRAVKTFNLRRKQKHKGPPKEAIKKGQEALARWREEQKKSGK